MKKSEPFFSTELFAFLRELKLSNNRTWFTANKARYEQHVKRPLQAFIDAFVPRLMAINPAYEQGKMFRIYRDTRFAKDKTPYKPNAAAQFLHYATSNDAHSPAFYLHLQPGECFMGGGIWAPDSATLQKIRAAIVARPREWAPLSKLELWGDSYVRPPKGVDPEHRFIADLKRKHFLTWTDFKDRQVLGADFIDLAERAAADSAPLVAFLDKALSRS